MTATSDDEGVSARGGLIASTTRRVDAVKSGALSRYQAVEDRVPHLSVGREFIGRYQRLGGTVLAGHIAFRSFLWLMPFALVLVALAGWASSTGVDVEHQAAETFQLGRSLGSTFKDAGADAQGTWWQAAFAAGSGLVLGTLGLLSGMHYAFTRVWELPRGRIEHKVKAALKFSGSIACVVLMLLGASAVRRFGLVGTVSGLALAAGFLFVAFLGLGLFMPRRAKEWYWLIPGAVVGAAGFLGLQLFVAVYFPTKVASASRTYGSLGVVFVLLAYLFLLGHVIIASGLASAVWYDHRNPAAQPDDAAPSPNAPAAPDP